MYTVLIYSCQQLHAPPPPSLPAAAHTHAMSSDLQWLALTGSQ